MPQDVPYNQLLQLRRASNCQITYNDLENDNKWEVLINNGQFEYCATIDKSNAEGSDGKHFVDYIQPKCNTPVNMVPDTIETHDFSNNTNWIFGNQNSLYMIRPALGKVHIMRESKLFMDKATNFNNQQISLVIWVSITQPCPAGS